MSELTFRHDRLEQLMQQRKLNDGQLAYQAKISKSMAYYLRTGGRDNVSATVADAGVPEPPLHAFRRAFALNALRNGMDVLTLQRLLGHSDLSVINRYVKLLHDDLRQGAEQFGVVDNL